MRRMIAAPRISCVILREYGASQQTHAASKQVYPACVPLVFPMAASLPWRIDNLNLSSSLTTSQHGNSA